MPQAESKWRVTPMAHATREYKTQVRGREHAGKGACETQNACSENAAHTWEAEGMLGAGHVSPTAHALRMQAARNRQRAWGKDTWDYRAQVRGHGQARSMQASWARERCGPLIQGPHRAARQVSLSFTISQSLLKLMSIELAMISNHPRPAPCTSVFPIESALHTSWPKYWRFTISSSNEYSGLTAFRIAWFDLLAVQGTLKSHLPGEVGGLIQNYIGIHWGVRGPAQLRKSLMQNSCCGLNMNFPNVCWILTVKAWGGRIFAGDEVVRVESHDGISALTKETPQTSLHLCGHKRGHTWTRKWILLRQGICQCLDPRLSASRTMRNQCLLFEPPVCGSLLQQPKQIEKIKTLRSRRVRINLLASTLIELGRRLKRLS